MGVACCMLRSQLEVLNVKGRCLEYLNVDLGMILELILKKEDVLFIAAT
jgi:hypothetical protein